MSTENVETATVKLDSLLAQVGQEVGLTSADCGVFDRLHEDDQESPQELVQAECDDAGMAWWNGLSEADRRYWCLAAMTAVPAEAWKYFRQVTAPGRPVRICRCD